MYEGCRERSQQQMLWVPEQQLYAKDQNSSESHLVDIKTVFMKSKKIMNSKFQ